MVVSLFNMNIHLIFLLNFKGGVRNKGNKVRQSERNNCNNIYNIVVKEHNIAVMEPELRPKSGAEMKGSFDQPTPLLPPTVCSMKS